MLEAIRMAAASGIEAGKPVAVLFGEVVRTGPLEVMVDQRFSVDEEFLVLPESLTRYEADLTHRHAYTDAGASGTVSRTTEAGLSAAPLIIRHGLEAGNKVILLRVQGGQKYVILDKVAGP